MQYWQFKTWVIFWLFLSGIPTIVGENQVQAQIVPDNTLGNESSIVTPVNTQLERIDGGAIRNNNLFHSFTEFNIGEGREAYFSNPAAIENIFSRVTGSNPSRIFGKLGVLGDANLYFLNPNGIIFGENSSLDIKGSFFASTANSLDFGNDNKYSAINPSAPPLLSVNVKPPIGLEFEGMGGDINSQGNLTVGKDLNLNANNLKLQGRLQAGRNLTLKAETVNVRDSVEKPFIAAANGNLLVQGKESVDIFALNNPRSGLFSAGNMTLSSANPVMGDIHFWSGGNFGIEKLDKTKGDLFSFYDPIIRSQGDVSIFGYQGASLHILAGGKVDINTAIITNPDTTGESINPVSTPKLANVTLSDGTSLVIDGSKKPTLDIRAGVNAAVIGNPLGTLGDSGIFFDASIVPVASPGNNSVATSADITIGDVFITAPNGTVLLTNQYEPNLSLQGGDINVNGAELIPSLNGIYTSFGGNGGEITIDSRSNISTATINSSSVNRLGNSGNGGEIKFIATKDISTTEIDSSSSSNRGNSGNGGSIAFSTSGKIFIAGDIDSSSYSGSGISGNGGKIQLNAGEDISTFVDLTSSGKLIPGDLDSSSLSNNGSSGYGGDITLGSGKDISVGFIVSSSSVSEGSAGDGGKVTILANRDIATQSIESYSSGKFAGNGGAIFLNAGRDILTTTDGSAGSLLSNSASSRGGNAANGGEINLNAGRNIFRGGIFSRSVTNGGGDAGNGGAVTLTAGDEILIINVESFSSPRYLTENFFSSGSSENFGSVGDGGNINITTGKKITIENSKGLSRLNASGKNGGDIILRQLTENISISDIPVNSNGSNQGDGGNILIEGESVSLFNTDITTTKTGEGNAGKITIATPGDVLLNRSRLLTALETGAVGRGGDIDIDANSVNLTNFSSINTSTYGKGDAGNLLIRADDSVSLANSSIFSITAGEGNAGQVKLQAGKDISLTGLSIISTAVNSRATGAGNNITIEANSLSLSGRSQLQALTQGGGNSGNIKVTTANDINIFGISGDSFSSGIFTLSEENSRGQGGNITLNTGGRLRLSNGVVLNAQTASEQKGGNIQVNARILELTNGAQFLTNSLSSGKAGNIDVNATEYIIISGNDPNSGNKDTVSSLPRKLPEPKEPEIINEVEPNNSFAQSQGIDTLFSLDSPDNFNTNIEFSTRIPYVSILGTGPEVGTADIYSFEVEAPGTRATFDIDRGIAGGGTPDFANRRLRLFDGKGSLLAENIKAPSAARGAGGSFTNSDPYLNFVFTEPGRYFIQVELPNTDGISTPKDYTLQASLDTSNIAGRILTNSDASGLFAQTENIGEAGGIKINTPQLTIQNGAKVSALTSNQGNGGNITLNIKDNLTLSGEETGIFANTTEESTGNGGSIIIDPETVNIKDGAQISVDSQGSGIGGDIELAAGTLNLDRGRISATTRSNTGGNIELNIQDLLLLRNRSQISTTAGEEKFGGDGGNIKINTPDGFIVAFPNENSDITANAFSGNGGNVDITAFGIFGIEFRDKLTAFSDITASSELGFDGNVNIETPGIEPNPETVELPEDAQSTEVAQGCQVSGEAAVAFFNIGRGGLPQQPGETLRSEDIIAAWIPLVMEGESQVDKKIVAPARNANTKLLFSGCRS